MPLKNQKRVCPKKFPNSEENEEVVGLLIIFSNVWILITNHKRLPQKSFVLTSLFIVAISGIVLFSGILEFEVLALD